MNRDKRNQGEGKTSPFSLRPVFNRNTIYRVYRTMIHSSQWHYGNVYPTTITRRPITEMFSSMMGNIRSELLEPKE